MAEINPVTFQALFEAMPRSMFEDSNANTRNFDPWNLAMAFDGMSPHHAASILNPWMNQINQAKQNELEARMAPYKYMINPAGERDVNMWSHAIASLEIQASKERAEAEKGKQENQLRMQTLAQQLGLKNMEIQAQNARHQTPSGDAELKSKTDIEKQRQENVWKKLGFEQKAEFHADDKKNKEADIELKRQGHELNKQKLASEELRSSLDPMKTTSEHDKILAQMESAKREPGYKDAVAQLGQERAIELLYQQIKLRNDKLKAIK